MFDKVILVVVVDIICLVNHDQVFLEALDAPTTMKIYALICTSNLFRSMRTFATLVQTCIVRCALEGISKVYSACGRYKFVGVPSLFILSLLSFVPISFVPISFVPFLFFLIDCVVRLSTSVNIVA